MGPPRGGDGIGTFMAPWLAGYIRDFPQGNRLAAQGAGQPLAWRMGACPAPLAVKARGQLQFLARGSGAGLSLGAKTPLRVRPAPRRQAQRQRVTPAPLAPGARGRPAALACQAAHGAGQPPPVSARHDGAACPSGPAQGKERPKWPVATLLSNFEVFDLSRSAGPFGAPLPILTCCAGAYGAFGFAMRAGNGRMRTLAASRKWCTLDIALAVLPAV
ncbi:hypothetical protein H6P81_016070 [Aristolochia fimbriata]|uniref:Uncharacterized protein n=1 Tax=Aristolochia fimbriata TaxID=158543 RepID=A0AAV7E9D0_ARIFI|nr:hypothetical protein H6P81_016070 [Aristolochia fimbriata]